MNEMKKLEIHEIIFETGDPEVVVKGKLFDGVLNYVTDIVINHTQLNALIGLIQKEYEGTDISDLFVSEPLQDGRYLYSANLKSFAQIFIEASSIFNYSVLKKIRA